MKVGLYFGSFNPIHVGHLIIANHVLEYGDVDQVWLVVSPHNPHKQKETLLADHHRLALVKEAVESNPRLCASDIEFGLPQPNYTVKTLAHLKEHYPDHTFTLIMGEDNLVNFVKWKNHERILEDYGLYVYPRPGAQPSELKSHPNVKMVYAPLLDISATFIRNCVRNHQSVRYLVPDVVEEMIRTRGFYLH